MKPAIRFAYIALVGLTVFMGALCIAQGARSRGGASAARGAMMELRRIFGQETQTL